MFKLWRNSTIFSLLLMYFSSIYLYLQYGEYSFRIFNKATGWVGVILIGLSLGLSGICYFWNALDDKIVYRKYLGIVGFVYGVIHTVGIVIALSSRVTLPDYLLTPDNIIPFSAAVIATIILAFEVIISNKNAMDMMGGKMWKRAMQFSYVAFIFVIIHFYLKTSGGVFRWIFGVERFPPIEFTLLVFSLLVIIMRLFVTIDLRVKKHLKRDKIEA